MAKCRGSEEYVGRRSHQKDLRTAEKHWQLRWRDSRQHHVSASASRRLDFRLLHSSLLATAPELKYG